MLATDTNRAQRLLRLLRFAQERGLNRQRLLDQVALTEEQVADPDARVTVAKTLLLWRLLADQIPDPDIGLEVGASFRIREGGVVGYSMLHSEDLLGAVRRLVRFAKLINQRTELALEKLQDRWRLEELEPPLITGFRPPIDEGMAAVMTVLRELLGRPLEPAAVSFNYPKPDNTAAHRRLFGPRLHFDQPNPAIFFWDRDATSPLTSAEPNLTRYLDELAEMRLDSLPRTHTWAEQVRQAVWPHLSEGTPAIERIAANLAISSRSLQRRLREEDTTFGEVVDHLRRDKARLLLRDSSLAVYEVGFLLGYSDPSAFHRAFRRWTGVSPREFRSRPVS